MRQDIQLFGFGTTHLRRSDGKRHSDMEYCGFKPPLPINCGYTKHHCQGFSNSPLLAFEITIKMPEIYLHCISRFETFEFSGLGLEYET